MPKLSIPLDAFAVTETAKRMWREARSVYAYGDGPTPFDEPMFKALIEALTQEINAAMDRAIVAWPENDDGLAHLSVFHPADGWVPLCKAGMFTTGNCLECSEKAKAT